MSQTSGECPRLEIMDDVARITLDREAQHNRIDPADLVPLRGYRSRRISYIAFGDRNCTSFSLEQACIEMRRRSSTGDGHKEMRDSRSFPTL